MGILGIRNRTENWQTADSFAPFFKDENARIRLVNRLLKPLGEDNHAQSSATKIELFWYGMRDLINQQGKEKELKDQLVDQYTCLFPCLREEIKANSRFRLTWNCSHYNVHTEKLKKRFFDNLRHTEIDIVLQTPKYLFIGEAKDESRLDAKSQYVLVHQLIKEYVTAKILVDITCSDKQVVPFVVGDSEKLESLRKTAQVRFMIEQCWLKEENVLSWDCIREIAKHEASSE